MKKMNRLLFGMLLLAGMFFVGCKDDTSTDSPVISFTNGVESTTVTSGQSWVVTGTITSVAGLDEVKYFTVTGTSETQQGAAITSFDDKNTFNFTVTVSSITQTLSLKVQATDKNNTTASKSYTITVGAAGEKVAFWTGSLAAQLGAQSSSVGSAYSTSNGLVYTKATAPGYSSTIDFYYYYSSTAGTAAEIMSPSFAGGTGGISSVAAWTTKNATKFAKVNVTATEFDNITKTEDALIISSAASLPDDRVTALAVGNVFAFQTVGTKKGLAKITAISGTDAGTISFEVKVQK
jgi:hypothetical protein